MTEETPEKDQLDRYYTSDALAQRMVVWAGIKSRDRVLEPSAGTGAIVRHLPASIELTIVEIDPEVAPVLRGLIHQHALGTDVYHHGDFLGFHRDPHYFDVAVMNSPFTGKRELTHLVHAVGMSTRVVALGRLALLANGNRFNQLWSNVGIRRMAVLCNRPVFTGPADRGHKAGQEYAVFELVHGECRTEIEWWEDSWK